MTSVNTARLGSLTRASVPRQCTSTAASSRSGPEVYMVNSGSSPSASTTTASISATARAGSVR
jgi:hypothetical protein